MSGFLPDRISWSRMGLAALLCAVILTPGHLATPDAHLRLAQARNLVSHGSLAVPEGVGNPEHGNLAPGRKGNMQAVYNPGHAVLLAPVYGIATTVPRPAGLHPHYMAAAGASFLGVLAHFLTGLILIVLLLRLNRSVRIALVIGALFAFGTVSLPLAADGYDHVFEGLAITLSFCLLVEDEEGGGKLRPGLAGLVLGAGVLFRYTVLLALPGLLWIARDRRSRLRLLLGLAPAVLLALSYNFYRFGSVFETGYPTAWRLAHGPEAGSIGFKLTEVPGNLVNLLASPGKGLLWFSPVIALAIPAWASFRRSRPKVADGVAATALLYLLFYAANFAWHGSVWSWGPRYIVPIVAPVAIAIAFLPKTRIWNFLFLVAGIISITVQASAVAADHRRHLLEEYTGAPSGFEQRVLHEPTSSPVVGQFESAVHVIQSTVEGGDYRPFLASGPWRSVARPASREMMLAQSIDLNVVDLWWIRLAFFSSDRPHVLVSILIGGLGAAGTVWLTGSTWRTATEV